MASKNDLNLVNRLLSLPSLTPETRADLVEFQEELRRGALPEEDRRYVRALAERLLGSTRGKSARKPGTQPSDEDLLDHSLDSDAKSEPAADEFAESAESELESRGSYSEGEALKQARLETLAEVKRVVTTLRETQGSSLDGSERDAREAVLNDLWRQLERLESEIESAR